MTLVYLLDTNIVSAPVSKRPNVAIVEKLKKHGERCAIAAPVWHELKCGCQRMPQGKRRAALDDYLTNVVRAAFPILPYDEAAATWHGLERARLESKGTPSPFVDGQIASIAHVNELIVVTLNKSDFTRYKDLQLETWV
ncbi:MAG: type II toxin-antitoxin system VapC family toxin [Polyangiales bacterium]